MLHIVNVEVVRRYYMHEGETEEPKKVSFPVEAENEELAEQKVYDHYKAKDSDYCVTHCVDIISTEPLIS